MNVSGKQHERGIALAKENPDAGESFSDFNLEDYELFCENKRHSRRNRIALSPAVESLIFYEKESDVEDVVKAIMWYITGTESSWYSDDSEVVYFRRLLAESFEFEWNLFKKTNSSISYLWAMRLLPQRFILSPPEKTQREVLTQLTCRKVGNVRSDFMLFRVWYVDLTGCMCSTLREFSFDVTAFEAIRTTMERLFLITNFDSNTTKDITYVFKVYGRKEFVYGDEALINFFYIRDCVTRQKEINVIIEPCETSLLTDPLFRPSYAIFTKQFDNYYTGIGGHYSNVDFSSDMNLWDVDGKLTVNFINSITNIIFPFEKIKEDSVREGDKIYFAVVVGVFFGTSSVCKPQMTRWLECNDLVGSRELSTSFSVTWRQGTSLTFDISISDLPRELRLCFTLVATCGRRIDYGIPFDAEEILYYVNECMFSKKSEDHDVDSVFFLGSASVQLFDHLGCMRTGKLDLRLWNFKQVNCTSPIFVNPNKNDIGLSLLFPMFDKPVVFPNGPPPIQKKRNCEQEALDSEFQCAEKLGESEIEQLKRLKRILVYDPLTVLTPSDKVILWKYREDLILRPKVLARFLLAVNWLQPYAVYETHSLLKRWAHLQPMDALELLDARYADTVVREHAVNYLDSMTDNELKGCILQLVHILKHEPYHYSALFAFLLKRSLQSPHIIGHYVFWHIISEMENVTIRERYGLFLEEFFRRFSDRKNYLRQLYVADQLLECAIRVKDVSRKYRVNFLQEHLKQLRLPSCFTLALHPAMECSGIDVSQCKVMDSKKSPLRLVFRNSQTKGEPFYVILKVGDDLRQDLLTLQLLEFMDTQWKSCGLYLNIVSYCCVATGDRVGMLEVVLNSDTIANITRTDGGAQAAFSEEPLMNWLRKFNKKSYEAEKCIWNFLYSTAGYIVATHVLGIGDRHNDNIMLRQDGTLFHIDFGHFLGNFKSKFGIKRETTPFVFTPMYAYVLGGQSSPIFSYFVDISCHAFKILRRFSNTLITFFMLMLSTGIPELQKVEDIEWLRNVLLIDCSDEEASEHYKQQILLALTNVRSLLNDYIHIVTH